MGQYRYSYNYYCDKLYYLLTFFKVGLDNAKRTLQEIVVLPALNPEVESKLNIIVLSLSLCLSAFCRTQNPCKGSVIIWTTRKWQDHAGTLLMSFNNYNKLMLL